MKLHLMSDLHLEFRPLDVPNSDADVLVLSGDVCVADYFTRSEDSPYYVRQQQFFDFFEGCSKNFDRVFYVMGNHEHYHGRFDRTAQTLKAAVGEFATVLDNEFVDYNGVRFVGTTLWTDFNKGDPVTEWNVERCLNDYRIVQMFDGHTYRKLRGFDTAKRHRESVQFVRDAVKDQELCVVMSHHAPSFLSVSQEYKDDYYLNGGYASDLSELMLDNPQVKMWTHGHMHHPNDYMLGETRVVSNPRGYPGENNNFDPCRVFEV